MKLSVLREHDLKTKRKKQVPGLAKPTSHKRQAEEARSSLKKITIPKFYSQGSALFFSCPQEQTWNVNGCRAVRKSSALFSSPACWKSHLHTVQTNAGGGWFSLLIFLPRVGNDSSALIRPDRCSHTSACTLHHCWPIGVMVWKADLLIILSDGCRLL